jgi:hypothetical protein
VIIKRKNQLVMVEPYGVEILVLCGDKEKDDFLKLNDGASYIFTPESNGCYWYGLHEGETWFIVHIGIDSKMTLMHESIHLAHCIMDHAGIPISIDNTEVEAYLACQIYSLIKPVAERVFNAKR